MYKITPFDVQTRWDMVAKATLAHKYITKHCKKFWLHVSWYVYFNYFSLSIRAQTNHCLGNAHATVAIHQHIQSQLLLVTQPLHVSWNYSDQYQLRLNMLDIQSQLLLVTQPLHVSWN